MCGVCGDPWDSHPRDHEFGGKFYLGAISAVFETGRVATFAIDIPAANEAGSIEFKVCPQQNETVEVTQQCLDANVLEFLGGEKTYTSLAEGINKIKVRLPRGLACDRCLLQWKYNTGLYLPFLVKTTIQRR